MSCSPSLCSFPLCRDKSCEGGSAVPVREKLRFSLFKPSVGVRLSAAPSSSSTALRTLLSVCHMRVHAHTTQRASLFLQDPLGAESLSWERRRARIEAHSWYEKALKRGPCWLGGREIHRIRERERKRGGDGTQGGGSRRVKYLFSHPIYNAEQETKTFSGFSRRFPPGMQHPEPFRVTKIASNRTKRALSLHPQSGSRGVGAGWVGSPLAAAGSRSSCVRAQ